MRYKGHKYTWFTNRQANEFTKERLDRVMANLHFNSLFQDIQVHTIAACTSNHNSPFVNIKTNSSEERGKERVFRHEYSWRKKSDCQDLISAEWTQDISNGSTIESMTTNLQKCKNKLINWIRSQQQATRGVMEAKKEKLSHLQQRNNVEDLHEIQQIKKGSVLYAGGGESKMAVKSKSKLVTIWGQKHKLFSKVSFPKKEN